MESLNAIEALSALAQESRLAAFRLAVQAGPNGLPAGEIAERLAVPHNTMSTHLAILTRAGLLVTERQGRRIIYRVDFAGMRALLAFLLKDCCRGAPIACDAVLDSIQAGCCPATEGPKL